MAVERRLPLEHLPSAFLDESSQAGVECALEWWRQQAAVTPGDVIHTLGWPSPNLVDSIGLDGVCTCRRRGPTGRAAVLSPSPMWMIHEAWRYLVRHGRIDQPTTTDDLGIMRSACVLALLARFEEVRVRSTSPATVDYVLRARVTADP